MKIGFVGVGKLGMPVAVACDLKGHDVMCYDVNPALLQKKTYPHMETGPDGKEPFLPYLQRSGLKFGSLADVVAHGEIIFVAVQTPHAPEFEGVTRLPDERKDFDYSYLEVAIRDLSAEIERQENPKTVAIISTVLPGTIRSRILPLTNNYVSIVYNPFFIAMGQTMADFLRPEFVLVGVHSQQAADTLKAFYSTVTDAPVYGTAVENAEAIKVFYNVYISSKIAFANTVMEACHKLPHCDVDEITNALKLATTRIISPAYMRGGMGDGGNCHPRDAIALSWLAKRLDLSYDYFEAMMIAREKQTEWLAKFAVYFAEAKSLPIFILGKSYKPETNLTGGSPAVLLANIVRELLSPYNAVFQYDPYVDGPEAGLIKAVYVIATKHDEFKCYPYPKGSVVIDPHRYIEDKPGVEIIRVGVGQ